MLVFKQLLTLFKRAVPLSYDNNIITFQSSYDHLKLSCYQITIILSSYFHLITVILGSSDNHITITLLLCYDNITLIFQPSDDYLTINLQSLYDHFTIILCSSYNRLMFILSSD
jgi:hypothetical protein